MRDASTIPVILAFHKLTPRVSYGVTNYSPKRFDKLLESLLSVGYQPCPLDDILTHNHSVKKFAVTFDDGYQHLCRYLPPMMETYGIIPTVFIPTGYIGKRNTWDYSSFIKPEYHLNKTEIQNLASLGVKFGTHSHRHIDLTGCPHTVCEKEILRSKVVLEDILSVPVTTISYPFGRYSDTVLRIAAEVGYQYGFTMRFPHLTDSRLTLGRFAVYSYDTRFAIFQKITRGPLYPLEKLKATVTNKLSGGTLLLNRLTRHTDS